VSGGRPRQLHVCKRNVSTNALEPTAVQLSTQPNRKEAGHTLNAGHVIGLAGEGEAIKLVPRQDLEPVLVQREVLEPARHRRIDVRTSRATRGGYD
jgi:hypothetical protein